MLEEPEVIGESWEGDLPTPLSGHPHQIGDHQVEKVSSPGDRTQGPQEVNGMGSKPIGDGWIGICSHSGDPAMTIVPFSGN
jgi:hypothetical protein